MIILAILVLTTATGLALAVTLSRDGHGSRPGPRSHHDPFDPHHRVR